MHHMTKNRPTQAAAAALLLVPASLLLAACGSSSSSSTTTTAATSASASTTVPVRPVPPGGFAGRFNALRECLAKNGINLPKRTPGQRPTPGLGLLGTGVGPNGAPRLPAGVTRAQYEAALKKCGGGRGGFFRRPGGGARLSSPAFQQALDKFAACMRENGENVPAPNTSGKGPIFNTSGLNTSSPQFRAAAAKCSADLRSSFAAPGGQGTTPPGGGA